MYVYIHICMAAFACLVVFLWDFVLNIFINKSLHILLITVLEINS